MFGKLMGKLANRKPIENKDLMEAVVAGCLLVAFADGELEKEEEEKMENLIAANDDLSHFRPADIHETVQKYARMLRADFSFGKQKMLKELADISGDDDHAETVFLCMVSIARADGEIEPEEQKVLETVAKTLRRNLSQYELA